MSQQNTFTVDELQLARREIDELQSKLTEHVKMLQEKASAIAELQSKMAEHEQEKSSIVADFQSTRGEVDRLRIQLAEQAEVVR